MSSLLVEPPKAVAAGWIVVLRTKTMLANTAGSLPIIVNRAGIGNRSPVRAMTTVVHRVPRFISSMIFLGKALPGHKEEARCSEASDDRDDVFSSRHPGGDLFWPRQ